MHLPTTLLLALATSTLAVPTPTPTPTPDSSSPSSRASLQGSSRNVYLTTCTTRSLFSDSTSSSAILYNGGATSTSQPSDIGTVSPGRSAIEWAGYTRRVVLGVGVFESKIDAGADALEKSQIAGSATLGYEQFACFRDGVSTFRFAGGVLGAETTVCTAEFWCASVSV